MMNFVKRGRGRGRGRQRRENVIETPPLQTTTESSPPTEFKCTACQLSFNRELDMTSHKMTHSELYDYECGQCDLVFEKLELLKRHFYSTHMGTSPVGGDERNVAENGAGNENDAVNSTAHHTDLQPWEASGENHDNNFDDDGYDGGGGVSPDEDDGGNSVSESNLTSAPIESPKKLQSDKPYSCSECGESFATFRMITDHLKEHNNEFQYFCEVFGCGKGFVKKQDRDRHEIRAHVPVSQRPKEVSHQCSVCEKYFTQKVHLKEHMKIHTNTKELPFPCKLCGKRFGKKSGLETHMMSIKHGGTGVSYRNKKKPKKSGGVSTRGRKRTLPQRLVQEESSDEIADEEEEQRDDAEKCTPAQHDAHQPVYVPPSQTGPTLMLATSSPPQQPPYQQHSPRRIVQQTTRDISGISSYHHQQQHVNTGYWRSSGQQQQQQFQVFSHHHQQQQQNQQVIGVPIAVLTLQDAFQNGHVIIGSSNTSGSS